MTDKRFLTIINRHLIDSRKELKIAKESLGMGYDASFRKMRKDWYEEWQAIVFCLQKGKESIQKAKQ